MLMPCYSPFRSKTGPLPCGACIGCKLERARQWAVRIVHESEMHSDSCFLTLTLEKMPSRCDAVKPCNTADGSLCVHTCQSFLKRLRFHLDPIKVRFFLCGEYGEKLGRPHYHMILFGYDFPDKVPLSENTGEYSLFSSDLLTKIWGLGHCSIGNVTFDSACYVANYATKKIVSNKAEAEKHYAGRKPEFLLMSRRPGIGRSWIDKFKGDVYPSDEVIVKGHSTRPPRYYDQVLEEVNPELLEKLKLKRVAEAGIVEEFELRDGSKYSVAPSTNARRLAVRERVAKAKLSLKSRKLDGMNHG